MTFENAFKEDWDYGITINCRGYQVSYSDVFIAVSQSILKWERMDRGMSAVVWVCDDEERPHGHGVLRTNLSQRQIKSAGVGGFWHLRKYDANGPTAWRDYINFQKVKGLKPIHNTGGRNLWE